MHNVMRKNKWSDVYLKKVIWNYTSFLVLPLVYKHLFWSRTLLYQLLLSRHLLLPAHALSGCSELRSAAQQIWNTSSGWGRVTLFACAPRCCLNACSVLWGLGVWLSTCSICLFTITILIIVIRWDNAPRDIKKRIVQKMLCTAMAIARLLALGHIYSNVEEPL